MEILPRAVNHLFFVPGKSLNGKAEWLNSNKYVSFLETTYTCSISTIQKITLKLA